MTDRHAQQILLTETRKSTDPARECGMCKNYYAAAFVRGFCPVLRRNVDEDDVCPHFRDTIRARLTGSGHEPRKEANMAYGKKDGSGGGKGRPGGGRRNRNAGGCSKGGPGGGRGGGRGKGGGRKK